MSRSDYTDWCDGWELIRWRGAVARAIRGQRGQQFLRDLVTALDALPTHWLIDNKLEVNGDVCALGSVGKLRQINMTGLDPYDRGAMANVFCIAPALAAEVMFENDEGAFSNETPASRWRRVRQWAIVNLKDVPHDESAAN